MGTARPDSPILMGVPIFIVYRGVRGYYDIFAASFCESAARTIFKTNRALPIKIEIADQHYYPAKVEFPGRGPKRWRNVPDIARPAGDCGLFKSARCFTRAPILSLWHSAAGLLLLFSISSIQGCAPSAKLETIVAKDPLPANCRPLIFLSVDEIPEHYETVTTAKYGDAGMSVSCGKEDIRVKMSADACKAGANGILIKKEKYPGLASTCYRVTADFISYQE